MEDRIPMLMHQETNPRMRVTVLTTSPKDETNEWATWSVWELWDRLPPSTRLETAFDERPSGGPLSSETSATAESGTHPRRCQPPLPFVMEVSADGEVTTWPGVESTPE